MEPRGYEERVKVYLRLLGDETLDQYPRCLSAVGRQCVRFSEPPRQRKSAAYGGAFPTRDKLCHTPLRRDSTRSNCEEATVPELSQDYNFDFVFEASDSVEFIHNYVNIDHGKVHCFLSVGKAATLADLVANYAEEVLAKTAEVAADCVWYNGEKVTPYEERAVRRKEDALALMREAEVGQGKKKEGITVLSLFYGQTRGAQFIEATTGSKLLDHFICAATNSDSVSDHRQIAKHRFFQNVQRSLTLDSRVVILGNVVPSLPHSVSAGWVVKVLSGAMDTKHRCYTFLVSLLVRQIETLKKTNEEQRKTDDVAALARENEDLKNSLKPLATNCDALKSDLAAKGKQLAVLQGELATSRTRILALETELASREQDLNTQVQYLSGISEETFEAIQSENRALKSKVEMQEAAITGLQFRIASKPGTEEKAVQVGEGPTVKSAPRLAVTRIAGQSIHGKKDAEKATILALREEVRVASEELARSRLPKLDQGEEDLRQARALYSLLAEVWIFTDSAVRSMKEQFDRLLALMEVKVAERDLKLAQKELAAARQPVTAELMQRAQKLETELNETRIRCAAAERDLRDTRELVRSENERLKEDHRKRLAQVTGQVNEMSEAARRLREEASSRDAETMAARNQWEQEKRELVEQIAELKDLRKPLATASKRK